MEKLRLILPQQKWGSLHTKPPVNSKLVGPDEFVNSSINLETNSDGSITKRAGVATFISGLTNPRDSYEAIFSDGAHHMLIMENGTLKYTSGTTSLSSIVNGSGFTATRNMEFAAYADRIYMGNGVQTPKVYDKTSSYGGVTYTVPRLKDMGAQAPASALSGAAGAAGGVPDGTYTYKVTFLYYDFEESNGGPASSSVTVSGGPKDVNLTSIPIGDYGVTARKIYRSSDGIVYRLVKTVADNTSTTATDISSTGTSLIPDDNFTPRTFSLIVMHKERSWVAGIPGDPSDLDFSEAGEPDIFPSANTITCNPADPITALVVFNDRVVVFNRHSFGEILGITSDSFRYSEVPGTVGCVDTRSIQIRTLHGVPVLLWLSDRGVYAWNGSSIEYISEPIENLINANIAQVSVSHNSNTQSSQTDFQGGTASGGIDLTSIPGSITTPNPFNLIDEQSEWEAGSSVDGIAARKVSNVNALTIATKNTFARSAGALSGSAVLSGSNIQLSTSTDYTGINYSSPDNGDLVVNAQYIAQRIDIPRAGTITNYTFVYHKVTGSVVYSTDIWPDNGSNQPDVGSPLYSSSAVYANGTNTLSRNPALSIPAGTYWFGINKTVVESDLRASTVTGQPGAPTQGFKYFDGSNWVAALGNLKSTVTFVADPIASSGTWTSTVYDSGLFPTGGTISVDVNHTSSFPATTSSVTHIQQADSPTMSGFYEATFGSLNGSGTWVTPVVKRYWRVVIDLAATDDRNTPSITSDPFVVYPTSITWISPTIDGTSDLTVTNQLQVIVGALPSGTTATAVLQKSNSSGSGFADKSTHTLSSGTNTFDESATTDTNMRYTRLKITLTNAGDRTVSPVITNISISWTIVANLQSQVIDTGTTPAGWDIFQDSATGNATFFFRTGASLIALAAASYVAITNGNFPSNTPLRYAQWKTILTSTVNAAAVVDSVTVNWFASDPSIVPVRAASLYHNNSYFLALTSVGGTDNSMLFEFDLDNNWREHEGTSVNWTTLFFFFNTPYFIDKTAGKISQLLSGTSDYGANINLTARMKAFNFDDPTVNKFMRKVFITGRGTGAVYSMQFSADGGANFHDMLTSTGSTSYTTTNDSNSFCAVFTPQWPDNIQGREILVEIQENTTAAVKIDNIVLHAFVRQGEHING